MAISPFEKSLEDDPSQRNIHEMVGQLVGAAKMVIWENLTDKPISRFALFLKDPNNFGTTAGGKKAAQKLLKSMENEGLAACGSNLSFKAWQLTKKALHQYIAG